MKRSQIFLWGVLFCSILTACHDSASKTCLNDFGLKGMVVSMTEESAAENPPFKTTYHFNSKGRLLDSVRVEYPVQPEDSTEDEMLSEYEPGDSLCYDSRGNVIEIISDYDGFVSRTLHFYDAENHLIGSRCYDREGDEEYVLRSRDTVYFDAQGCKHQDASYLLEGAYTIRCVFNGQGKMVSYRLMTEEGLEADIRFLYRPDGIHLREVKGLGVKNYVLHLGEEDAFGNWTSQTEGPEELFDSRYYGLLDLHFFLESTQIRQIEYGNGANGELFSVQGTFVNGEVVNMDYIRHNGILHGQMEWNHRIFRVIGYREPDGSYKIKGFSEQTNLAFVMNAVRDDHEIAAEFCDSTLEWKDLRFNDVTRLEPVALSLEPAEADSIAGQYNYVRFGNLDKGSGDLSAERVWLKEEGNEGIRLDICTVGPAPSFKTASDCFEGPVSSRFQRDLFEDEGYIAYSVEFYEDFAIVRTHSSNGDVFGEGASPDGVYLKIQDLEE